MKKKILCLVFVLVLIFQTGCVDGRMMSAGVYIDGKSELENYLLNEVTVQHDEEKIDNQSISELYYLLIFDFERYYNKMVEYYKTQNLELSRKEYFEIIIIYDMTKFKNMDDGKPSLMPIPNSITQIITLELSNGSETKQRVMTALGLLNSVRNKYVYEICDCKKDVCNLGGSIFTDENYEDPDFGVIVKQNDLNASEFSVFWNNEDHTKCWYNFFNEQFFHAWSENETGIYSIPYELQREWIQDSINNDVNFYYLNGSLTDNPNTAKFVKIK